MIHLFTATTRRGRTPIRVDVYEEAGGLFGEAAIEGASGTPATLPLESVRIRSGDPRTGFGAHVRPSWAVLDMAAADGLDDVVNSADALSYLWRIAWDGHVWYGHAQTGESVRSIAPAVHPRGTTTVRLWDRLAALADEPGLAMQSYPTIADWLSGVLGSVSRHLPIVYASGVAWGVASLSATPTLVRFASELRDESEGDYGTMLDQLARYAETKGLVCLQQTEVGVADPDGSGPALWLVPRQALLTGVPERSFSVPGVSITYRGARRIHQGAETGVVLEAPSQIVLTSGMVVASDGGLEHVPPIRAVKVDTAGELTPAAFPHDTGPGQIVGGSGTLDDGEVRSRSLGSLVPEQDTRVRLSFDHFGTETGGFPRKRAGGLRLEAVMRDGNSLWLNAQGGLLGAPVGQGVWQDAPVTIAAPDGGPVWRGVSVTAPAPGVCSLVMHAVGGRREAGGVDVLFEIRSLSVLLVDEQDRAVVWTTYRDTEAVQGETITIGRPPIIERFDGVSWAVVDQWLDQDGVVPVGSLLDHAVRQRVDQQGRTLIAPRCRIKGLAPVGAPVRFPADLVGADIVCLPGGGVDAGMDDRTDGAWTEVAS